MPGKVCTASLLPLDQPVPFKDILPSPVWEHPGPAVTAGRGNSPQQALLGQLMLNQFVFAYYLPLLSAQTQRGAAPPFHVPVPINANSQEGGGGTFPKLPITAHSLPAQIPASHRVSTAVPRGKWCRRRVHPNNLQEFWSGCGSHHGTGCLPNVPAGRLCPPCIPGRIEPPPWHTPRCARYSSHLCHLPRGNKEVSVCHHEPFRPCAVSF